MKEEKLYWLGFSAFPGIGPLRFKLLLGYFGSAKDAWNASKAELVRIGLGNRLTDKFDRFRREFSLSGYGERVKNLGISVLTITDKKYPQLLREIPDAPFLLYIKKGNKIKGNQSRLGASSRSGFVNWDIEKSVAVVGTRRVTRYGREVTRRIVSGLADVGVTVVSGLALGVDAIAHQTAIDTGGKTIAVLGCGVDCCYPRANQLLYDRIAGGYGVIISEFPLSQRVAKGLFPARNRIISGLSLGVVVTEGAYDSGALITASYAAKQGREVFAVPGPVTSPFSKATSKLLKAGAKLVESAEDVLEELDLGRRRKFASKRLPRGETADEDKILALLSTEDLSTDEIIQRLDWQTGRVLSVLSVLEIRRVVKNEGGLYSLRD